LLSYEAAEPMRIKPICLPGANKPVYLTPAKAFRMAKSSDDEPHGRRVQ
jgi:hypothetical protein